MQFGSIFALIAVFLILAHGEDDKKDLGDLITCEEDSQCKCGKTEPPTITCDHVMFKDEEGNDDGLTTANLKFTDTSTVYKVVKLTNNNIKSLTKKEIVPTLANNLEELDFSNNEIQVIDGKAFDDFVKLKVLKLSYNHLKFDDMKNVFTPKLGKHLDRLDLDYNKQLDDVPKDFFDGLTNLRTLVLDGNVHLDLTAKTFNGLKNLETLSLDDCNIEDLPDGIFDGLSKLNKLSLRGNPLDKIPDVINKIENLKILDLSETKISMIKSCAFCGLEELKIIYFTNCTHLSSIDDDAFGSKSKKNPPKLEEVHFDNCNLTTFHEDLAKWEDLQKISIGGNPLNCDCDLKWLLENPHLQTFNGVTPTCAQPESLKNKPLNKVNDEVCPQYKSKSKAKINTRVFFMSFVFFVLVIAAIFGFIQYTRRRGRLTNVFYRPELPQMSYNNLPANPDLLSENYTYSIQQDTPAEEL